MLLFLKSLTVPYYVNSSLITTFHLVTIAQFFDCFGCRVFFCGKLSHLVTLVFLVIIPSINLSIFL